MKIIENFETEVVKSCDVLVCGGGFGGISAALAAARQGKKVILLEKQYILGGLGTAGIVNTPKIGLIPLMLQKERKMIQDTKYGIIQACLLCSLKSFW